MTACERCGSTEGVQPEASRTAYYHEEPLPTAWDKLLERKPESPPDPNRDVWLCRGCAEEHHSYWDDCWAAYYGSIL